MRTVTFVRITALSGLALVVLIAIWLMLMPIAPAQSIGRAPALNPSPPITDTRWLDLIQSRSAKNQLSLPTLNIHLTDGVVAGHVASGATVIVSITRDSSEIARTAVMPLPDGDSYWYTTAWPCYYGGGCYYFQPGNVVWVTQFNASVSMTVPTLTGFADTNYDRVYGAAPISQPVTVYLYPLAAPELLYTQTITTDASGQYQVAFTPTIDLRPRDNGYVAYTEVPGRAAYTRFVAPLLRAALNGKEVSGYAAPRSWVAITVTAADSTPRFETGAYAGTDGWFEAYAYWYDWTQALSPGDHIRATSAGQVVSTTVMTITARADLINGLVWGEALAGQSIEVLRFTGPVCCVYDPFWRYTPAEQTTVTATAAGQYTAAVALSRPNYGAVIMTMPDGHQIYARFAVPYLSIRMGATAYLGYQMVGQVDEPSAPITIVIQGPSGYLKDVRRLTGSNTGYFYDEMTQRLALDIHDVITVTTPRGVQAAVVLPQLTGRIGPDTDVVSGLAPPGARLTVTVYDVTEWPVFPPPPFRPTGGGGPPDYPYTVFVTATAQGEYLIDLHGVIDLTADAWGETQYTTPDGHTIRRVFVADQPQGCYPRLHYISVGGNQVSIGIHPCSEFVSSTLRLRDVHGQLKYIYQFNDYSDEGWHSWSKEFYSGTQPVLILPGDTLELQSHTQSTMPTPTPAPTLPSPATPTPYAPEPRSPTGDQLVIYTVPTLTVALDPIANTITGQAPPSATLSYELYREQALRGKWTIAADAQGAYSASVNNVMALMSGDRTRVFYYPAGQPIFYTAGVLPLLRHTLRGTTIDGWLPPFTPYTVTLDSPRSITTVVTGRVANNGSLSIQFGSILPGDTIVMTTPQRVFQLGVPTLTAQVDQATGLVYGQAPPHARLQIDLTSHHQSQIVTAAASGVYTASFAQAAPLASAYGTLTYFDADGNQVRLNFSSARWEVDIGSPCLNGVAGVANETVTLALYSDSGAIKDVITTHTGSPGGDFSTCFHVSVHSRDRLVMTRTIGPLSYTVPILTAKHDYARQAVIGEAPPNGEVVADFWVWYPAVTRHTYADGSGRYGVDTSDLHLPIIGQTGRVKIIDVLGNTTTCNFAVTGYRVFLPIMRK